MLKFSGSRAIRALVLVLIAALFAMVVTLAGVVISKPPWKDDWSTEELTSAPQDSGLLVASNERLVRTRQALASLQKLLRLIPAESISFQTALRARAEVRSLQRTDGLDQLRLHDSLVADAFERSPMNTFSKVSKGCFREFIARKGVTNYILDATLLLHVSIQNDKVKIADTLFSEGDDTGDDEFHTCIRRVVASIDTECAGCREGSLTIPWGLVIRINVARVPDAGSGHLPGG